MPKARLNQQLLERTHWQSRDKKVQDDQLLFPVMQGCEEFEVISAEFKRSLPLASVDRIERVENGDLHDQDRVQRKAIERFISSTAAAAARKGGGGEQGQVVKMLFHGTSEQAVQCIIRTGFNPVLAGVTNGNMWGDGTYFASNAAYSDNYACRLASGQKQVSLDESKLEKARKADRKDL